jgi:hypothetical protein
MELTMDEQTTRIIYGIYYAITSALPPDTADLVHETIFRLANSPDIPEPNRGYYKMLAENMTKPLEEVAEENARNFRQANALIRRGDFDVIPGDKD